MRNKIADVRPGSPASKTAITAGDVLCRVNGNVINDVLDYEYHSYDSNLSLQLKGSDGRLKLVRLRKQEGQDLGLGFEDSLMDTQRSCSNNCIFCFIDQLPKGMRETLYYKDDDVRLSFLQGNYVTLTNLADSDIERIIKLRISPINVSVHTLTPKIRQLMLGHGNRAAADRAQKHIKELAHAGITLNCQIVCCPGINDRGELRRTIKGLVKLGESINSVSVVPVGLTKHREGLYALRSFDKMLAAETVRIVEAYGARCREQRGSTVFYCSDELYMTAGLELPPDSFYEDYPQLENGVGMMRLFITEFEAAAQAQGECGNINCCRKRRDRSNFFSLVTGKLADSYLTKLLQRSKQKYCTIDCEVHAVVNEFFGEGVTVSGLVTGRDIIGQLSGKNLGSKVLIPQNMLRSGSAVFLDDVTVGDLSKELGVPVQVVGQDGKELFDAITF